MSISNVKALIKTEYVFSQPFQYNISEALIYQDPASLCHQKNDPICYLSSIASFFIHFFYKLLLPLFSLRSLDTWLKLMATLLQTAVEELPNLFPTVSLVLSLTPHEFALNIYIISLCICYCGNYVSSVEQKKKSCFLFCSLSEVDKYWS